MQEVVIGKSLIYRKEKNLLLASMELRKEEMKKKRKSRVKGSELPLFSISILHSRLGEDVRNQTTPRYVFRKWSLMWHQIKYTWLTMVEKTSV